MLQIKHCILVFIIINLIICPIFADSPSTLQLKRMSDIDRTSRLAWGTIEFLGGIGLLLLGKNIWDDSLAHTGAGFGVAFTGTFGFMLGLAGSVSFIKGMGDIWFSKTRSEEDYEKMSKLGSFEQESFASDCLEKYKAQIKK